MAGSRSKKKERATHVPTLNFGGGRQVQHDSHTPRMNAFSNGSKVNNNKKDLKLNEGKREAGTDQPVERTQVSRVQTVPHSFEVSSQMPAMTPRGTSSYKDILLTPRFQVQHSRGSMTSRESPVFSNTIGRQQMSAAPSPQTSRPQRRQKHVEVPGPRPLTTKTDANNSHVQSDVELLYQLAGLIKALETADERDSPVVHLQLSKGMQVIARRIGLPAGVLDMLKLHEQQRISPKIRGETVDVSTRAVNSPRTKQYGMHIVTPEVRDTFRSISSKISEIETILLHNLSE